MLYYLLMTCDLVKQFFGNEVRKYFHDIFCTLVVYLSCLIIISTYVIMTIISRNMFKVPTLSFPEWLFQCGLTSQLRSTRKYLKYQDPDTREAPLPVLGVADLLHIKFSDYKIPTNRNLANLFFS